MGNYLSYGTSQPFPCAQCGDIFQRPIEGSLLCGDCRKNFHFEKLTPIEKSEYISEVSIYPMYSFLSKKQPIILLKSELSKGFSEKVADDVKPLSVKLAVRSKYKIIKSILKHLDQMNFFPESDFKGLYIHSMKSNDLLFIHDPNIKDKERVYYIDIDKLLKLIS